MSVQNQEQDMQRSVAANDGAADADRSSEQAQAQAPEGEDRHISPWEWLVAFVGLVLVGSSIVFMLYQALAGDESPPNITIHVDAIAQVQDGYLVTIRALNNGGTTAAEVTVEGTLVGEAGAVERSAITIDYVPAHSEQSAGLFFTHDPRQLSLELRAHGYRTP